MAESEFPGHELGHGDRIGAYRIEGWLGRGGMGEVLLAWDERLRRHVAIKRIRRRTPEITDEQRERFRREARAVASLTHPAIVQVFDILDDEDGDCIVMERVEGECLGSFLRRGPLDLGWTVRLVREIAEGLATAHDKGLIHRDLKADNVMVTPAGHPKILDFGLVLQRGAGGRAKRSSRRLGTIHAMAPEVVAGGEVDARADLFSLGVLLYEMSTGARPFQGEDREATLRSIEEDSPRPAAELNPHIPPALADLIDQLLAKDPSRRPQSALKVAATLRALETTVESTAGVVLPTTAPIADLSAFSTGSFGPPTLPTASSRLGRRGALAVLASLVLAVGGATVWQTSRVWLTPGASEPRRVVVLQPEIAQADDSDTADGLRLVGSAVLTATFEGLLAIPGLAPLDPREVPDPSAAPDAIGLATGADEILAARVEPWQVIGDGCRVTLLRFDAKTGTVLWTGSFEAPVGSRELRLVADSVAIQLHRAYPGESGSEKLERPDVRDQDYADFLALWQAFKADGLGTEDRRRKIDEVLAGSPRFLLAHLLAADLALADFSSNREVALLDRSRRLVERAEALAPEDPRPAYRRFRVELQSGDLDAAERALKEAEGLSPGDIEVLFNGSLLAERRGRPDVARELLLRAVDRRPGWATYLRLARLEMKSGQPLAARGHLEKLLEIAPDNALGVAKLAEVELLYGDLDLAENLYRRQIARKPLRSLHTNLGLALYLQERYPEAVASYAEALKFQPDHPIALFNLADAELASGDVESARQRYRQVLEQLETLGRSASLDADEHMTIAQCLAHLGQAERARELTATTLAAHPTDAEVVYQAAVVYALLADERAIPTAHKALELGVQPRWLTIPQFASIRDHPSLSSPL